MIARPPLDSGDILDISMLGYAKSDAESCGMARVVVGKVRFEAHSGTALTRRPGRVCLAWKFSSCKIWTWLIILNRA